MNRFRKAVAIALVLGLLTVGGSAQIGIGFPGGSLFGAGIPVYDASANANWLIHLGHIVTQIAKTVAILDKVTKTQKYFVGAINNEPLELNQYRIDRFELRRYFRIFLSSCYLGVAKPHGAMFETALHVLQRPPSACAFIDDHVANVEAARRAGIVSLHYREPSQLRAWLIERGIETTKEMSCGQE